MVIKNLFVGIAKSLVLGLGKNIKKNIVNKSVIKVKSNSKEIVNELTISAKKFGSSIKEDTVKLKNTVKEGLITYKNDIVEDSKTLRNDVDSVIDIVEVSVSINELKLIEFKNRKIRIKSELIEKYVSDILNFAVNLILNTIMNTVSGYTATYMSAA